MAENIDAQVHKKAFSLWYSLQFLGEPFATFFSYFIMNNANASWNLTFWLNLVILAVITIAMHVFLPEVSNMKRNEQEAENVQQPSTKRYLIEKKDELKWFFKEYFGNKPRNVLLILDGLFQRTQGANILMWFPYFFTQLNFQVSVLFISSAYFIISVPGNMIYEQIMQFSSPTTQKNFSFILLVLSLGFTIFLPYIDPVEENSSLYLLIICLFGFVQAGPCCRIVGNQIVQSTGEDTKLRYYAFSFLRFAQMTGCSLFVIITGWLINISTSFFIQALTSSFMSSQQILCFMSLSMESGNTVCLMRSRISSWTLQTIDLLHPNCLHYLFLSKT